MQSLHGRLLVVSTLVLAGFLGAAGLALYEGFRDSAEAALRQRLQDQVYALLAAAGEDADGRLVLPTAFPDPRYSNPDSGLYALVRGADGGLDWRSPSLTGRDWDFLQPQSPGSNHFHRQFNTDQELLVLNAGIAWLDYADQEQLYTLAVAMDTAPLLAEIESFSTSLWAWLGGFALFLLLAQGVILSWGLQPLRRVADDLNRIEAGRADRLEGEYPRELRGLTGNINSLIAGARANQQRYRNSLDDLAHSMKTPLAILRNAADENLDPAEFRTQVGEQVERMDGIVQHQLRRAAAAGKRTLGQAVAVAPLVERLARSLQKVYREKALRVELVLSDDARFFGDAADLMEVLGNVMENAFKYGVGRVRVSADSASGVVGQRAGLELHVADDGPGIDPRQAEAVMQRGRRLDQQAPGQGIGLSVAREIVGVYDGAILIQRSDLGGVCVQIRFPGD
jgi:two-component system sensor histidine kinase PhoQ